MKHLKKVNWEDGEFKEFLNQVEKKFEGGNKNIRCKKFQKTYKMLKKQFAYLYIDFSNTDKKDSFYYFVLILSKQFYPHVESF